MSFHGRTSLLCVLDEVKSISLVEQERALHRAHLAVSPVLAQDVGRVVITSDVVEGDHAGRNRLARVVVGKRVVAF